MYVLNIPYCSSEMSYSTAGAIYVCIYIQEVFHDPQTQRSGNFSHYNCLHYMPDYQKQDTRKLSRKTHRVADKALVDSSDGSPVVQETVVAPVSVPRSVSECRVQLNHVTFCREHKLSRVTVDGVIRIKQLYREKMKLFVSCLIDMIT